MPDNRVATTEWVRSVHRKTAKKPFNRRLSREGLDRLDPDGKHIVEVFMIHEHRDGEKCEPHYRCRVLLKVKGSDDPVTTYIDVPFADYDLLPSVDQWKAEA